MVNHKKYLKSQILNFLAIFALVGLVNFVVDPLGAFKIVSITNFNKEKIYSGKYQGIAKAWRVKQVSPKTIILGTSRAAIAYNPEHPVWNKPNTPSYNLGLSAGNSYMMLRYFQHAHRIQKIDKCLLTLDFFAFNTHFENIPEYQERRLSVSADGSANFVHKFYDLPWLLFNIDNIFKSWETIKLQNKYENLFYLSNGQQDKQSFKNFLQRRNGHREAFLTNEKVYINRVYFPRPHQKYEFGTEINPELMLDHYRRILEIAYKDNIEVTIVINPSHARQWEVIRVTKLWDKFETWKKKLVEINEEEALKADSVSFPVWDFSGYNSLTTEAVPPLGDITTEMKYYYESSHFKEKVGDMVLSRIYNYPNFQTTLPDDFGVKINSKNLDSHLKQIRESQQRYQQNYPNDVKEIEQLLQEKVEKKQLDNLD